ncbi:rho GTPase-activating protein 24-like isoform X2 [Trichechus manatus latirostris]|uniref:Rho GTPase-activating protein 24-like isoform X2 n=1 Tax=Trichechus manatus latirostris TaxID=127582 RepID=A0A2Y9QFJ0_TRIMA|nr:rho GTPase-activating protein 24-like isoform X2 [Trichechus manatus latirostris]
MCSVLSSETVPHLPLSFLAWKFLKTTGKSISLIMEENNDFGENPQQGQGQQSGMKCGWLRKQGGFVKTWHTRWFVLKGDQLYYFKDEEETKPLGTIFLPGNKVLEHPCNEDSPGKFFFEVVPDNIIIRIKRIQNMLALREHPKIRDKEGKWISHVTSTKAEITPHGPLIA